MTLMLFSILYLTGLIFLIGCIVRFFMYARLPLHLRWELYPVPHEAPHRAAHGGSYFEDLDWWEKPKESSLIGEARVMVPEILFLKALWEHNRTLWFRSFPFHFGLYLLIGTALLVAASGLFGLFAPSLAAGGAGNALHIVCIVCGGAGAVLAISGAMGLLIRRLGDAKLKNYTTPGDIFNLLFFIAALGITLAGYLTQGADAPGMAGIAAAVLSFDTSVPVPVLLGIGLILLGLLCAYIPMTHMSHFIGKYFTYHSVRWSDEPNRRGGAIEKKLMEYLTYRPTWSAKHMKADGKKTWADVATTNPTDGE